MASDHRERHKELHKALDELLACYVTSTKGGLKSTIGDLVKWSHEATQDQEVCKSR